MRAARGWRCRVHGSDPPCDLLSSVPVVDTWRSFFGSPGELEPIGRDELLRRARGSDIVLLDLRPREEYEAGHIPRAISIPLDGLKEQLALLPPGAEIVAYSRGPYCLMAPRGIALLRRHWYRVRRLKDSVGEWRLAGLLVAAGTEPVRLQ